MLQGAVACVLASPYTLQMGQIQKHQWGDIRCPGIGENWLSVAELRAEGCLLFGVLTVYDESAIQKQRHKQYAQTGELSRLDRVITRLDRVTSDY